MRFTLTFAFMVLVCLAKAQTEIPQLQLPEEPEPPDPGHEYPQDAIVNESEMMDNSQIAEYPYSDLVNEIKTELTKDDMKWKILRNTLLEEGRLPGFPTLEEFEKGTFSSAKLDLVMIQYIQRLVKTAHRQQKRIKALEEEIELLKN